MYGVNGGSNVGTDYFVRKLRASVVDPAALKSQSWGYFHLLSAALRKECPENARIENLIAILRNCLGDAIADSDAGREPDLGKLMTVLDAIEFHLARFETEADESATVPPSFS